MSCLVIVLLEGGLHVAVTHQNWHGLVVVGPGCTWHPVGMNQVPPATFVPPNRMTLVPVHLLALSGPSASTIVRIRDSQ
jgi:hypothetical protein